MSAAEIRARVSFCQFRPWLRLSPGPARLVTWGPITCGRAGCQGVWKPRAPAIRGSEHGSVFHTVPLTSGGPWGDRKEGALFGVGAGPGEALWGRRGVDEISGCAEVSFQPACLGSRKVIATPNTLLNEAQPARTSRCLPAFFPVGGNSPS